jgi:hypothetical protein
MTIEARQATRLTSNWFLELLKDAETPGGLKKVESMDHVSENTILKRRRKQLGDQLFEVERRPSAVRTIIK